MIRAVILLAALATATVASTAQSQPNKPTPETVRERILELRLDRLERILGLTAKQKTALDTVLRRSEAEFAALGKAAKTARPRLRHAVQRGDVGKINEVLDHLVELRRMRAKLFQDRFASVRRVLEPGQAARFFIVLPRIDRRIRGLLRSALEPPPSRSLPRPDQMTD